MATANTQNDFIDDSYLFDVFMDPAFNGESPVVASAQPMSAVSSLSVGYPPYNECGDRSNGLWLSTENSPGDSNSCEIQFTSSSASTPAFGGTPLTMTSASNSENTAGDTVLNIREDTFDAQQTSNQEGITVYWTPSKSDSLEESGLITPSSSAGPTRLNLESTASSTLLFNRRGTRGPRSIDANGVLQAWYTAHLSYPFPTNDEKSTLSKHSGNSLEQVSNWFNNKRSRNRKDLTILPGITAPPPSFSTSEDLNLERPQQFLAVNQAVASLSNPLGLHNRGYQNLSGGRKGKSRIYGGPNAINASQLPSSHSEDCKKPWPCTFPRCGKSSKNRYEWKRHESSHLIGSWICMPDNTPIIGDSCGLCGMYDPNVSHFRQHFDIDGCCNKEHHKRAFCRKDKLQEHIYRVHLKPNGHSRKPRQRSSNTTWSSLLDQWQIEQDLQVLMPEALWCGFCGLTISNWAERQEHVGNHLQTDAKVIDWREFL